ncbi:15924_t:CDS:2, partial [Dentiscutata heterogama]
MSNKIHEYFDTAYSQWNIRDFLDKCNLEPFGQKIACYIRSLETIASCETDHRRERAKELLDRYKEATSVGAYTTYESSYVQGFDRSNTGPAEAYIPYEESYVQGFDRPSRGTRPDRKLARNWDKERSHKCKSVEPSVHVHHPTFIGGGTVSGIINSETFASGSSDKDQKKAQDPVDKINAFFTDSTGVKVTKFVEKLRELSDDSKKTFNGEDKVESELQNSPSASNDNGSNYMP